MENTEKLYVVLPVHNRRELTRELIRALQTQTFTNFHLLLIDDGSRDGTENMVREAYPLVTVLRGNGNWWWGGSLHQAYGWLKAQELSPRDSVLIINDDTRVGPDFLATGLSILRENPRSLLLAQCFSIESGKLLDRGIHIDWKKLRFEQATDPQTINCLSTRGLFLKAHDFIGLGGFYPWLLPHYAADYEFTIRAFRRGFKLMTDSRVKIHVHESTTGFETIRASNFFEAVTRLFSLKCTVNPLVWTVFVALACPPVHKFRNFLRVWKYAGITAWRAYSDI